MEFFFWKYYFRYTAFYIRPHVLADINRIFFYFRFSGRKSQSQQKLAKKIIHFTIQFRSNNFTHFTNLILFDIENNMLPQNNQKPFSLYKFSSKYFSVWCYKKDLHCIICWCQRTAFLKHFESKCLYISASLRKKTFVPET